MWCDITTTIIHLTKLFSNLVRATDFLIMEVSIPKSLNIQTNWPCAIRLKPHHTNVLKITNNNTYEYLVHQMQFPSDKNWKHHEG